MPLILAGLILLFGSVVQGAIGFALGMIAVPLAGRRGLTACRKSVALTTLAIGIQVLAGAWQAAGAYPLESEVRLAALVRYRDGTRSAYCCCYCRSRMSMATDSVKPLRRASAYLLGVAAPSGRPAASRSAKSADSRSPAAACSAVSGVLARLGRHGRAAAGVVDDHARLPRAKQARAFTMTLFLLNAPLQVLLLLFLFADDEL